MGVQVRRSSSILHVLVLNSSLDHYMIDFNDFGHTTIAHTCHDIYNTIQHLPCVPKDATVFLPPDFALIIKDDMPRPLYIKLYSPHLLLP